MSSRLSRIDEILTGITCVRDFVYESPDRLNKYCGTCVLASGNLTFADVTFSIVHRAVIDVTGYRPVTCDRYSKNLTYALPFRNYHCTSCANALYQVLTTVDDSAFARLHARTDSIIVMHGVTRQGGIG